MSTVTSSTTTGMAGVPSSLTKTSPAATATTAREASDRFLKLLVTQLQNQDPMNPMDRRLSWRHQLRRWSFVDFGRRAWGLPLSKHDDLLCCF